MYISRYMDNVPEKSIEEQIQEFKEYHGDKSFHISGGGTEYPGTPQEKYVPRKIIKGPIRWSRCKLCNEPLEELQNIDPKRRLLKYCSDECRKEHDEIKKIRKKLGAENVWWSPHKPPVDKTKLTYTIAGEGGIQHKYKGRKPRTKKINIL